MITPLTQHPLNNAYLAKNYHIRKYFETPNGCEIKWLKSAIFSLSMREISGMEISSHTFNLVQCVRIQPF